MMISYKEAVAQARAAIENGCAWVLGDIVADLEPKYGEETLQRFAADIGVSFSALSRWRDVARAWPEKPGRPGISVAQALATHPERYELIEKNPKMTCAEARKLMREYKQPPPDPEPIVDGESLPSVGHNQPPAEEKPRGAARKEAKQREQAQATTELAAMIIELADDRLPMIVALLELTDLRSLIAQLRLASERSAIAAPETHAAVH